MTSLIIRPCLLTLAVTLAVIGQPAVALADTGNSVVRYFDLPAADLGDSLSRLSRESGRTLSANPALLQGRRAPALRGPFSPEQAAQQLLAGSGLGLSVTENGTWTLYLLPQGGALNLGATTVTGQTAENAWGPVDGYVATRSATGTKTDTPIMEIPQTVNVVTADQIKVQGARNLTQALRYTPGIDTNGYTDRNTTSDEVGSRGFAPTLLYLDGAYLPYAGSLGGAPQIDPYTLERIEVLKGPASVLYGQNQPGGMVNLVSKRPTTDARHQVKLGIGSYDRVNGAVDVSGPIDEEKTLSYRLIGLVKDGNEMVDHTSDSRTLIAPSLTWAPNDDTALTVYAQLQRDKALADYQALPSIGTLYRNSQGRHIDRDAFLGDSDWNNYIRDQYVLGYDFSHAFSDTLEYRQTARFTDVNDRYKGFYLNRFATLPDGSTDDTRATRTKLDWRQHNSAYTIDNNLQAKFSTGTLEHTLLTGVDYRQFTRKYQGYNLYNAEIIDLYKPTNYHTFGQPVLTTKWNNTVEQTGLYAQDQIKFDRFILTIGLREDWAEVVNRDLLAHSDVSQKDKKLTRRIGLAYLTDFGLAPYVSYAESFFPSTGSQAPQRGSQAFKPVEGEQYEAGLKYQPNDSSLLTLSVFQIKQKNVLTGDLVFPEYQLQEGEVRSRGVEFEGKARVGQVELIGALSYLDSFYTKSNYGNEGNRNEAQAPWTGSVWADYHFASEALAGLTLGGGARYTGKKYGDSDNTFKVPSFVVYDATVSYDLSRVSPTFKGAEASLNVQNVFNRDYVSSCNYAFGCYYGQERTASLAVTYDW
ncbi:TonB-dependent siderophore receptor [Pseudomonas yamanorum]|jgi:iron complex outermembrane receptor protein|uniref:TonB-dependent siderophore receptor n=1 Tax=Pseudomonas yamanorum TaxID=515393 RepID=UPI0015A4E165|nr:TonB-dependent siderophore receptor [Pseudomonas yamanorum]NWD27598.1 TonB-dependent siderophore receptor [Pseudomonas yamanorum]